MTQQPVDPEPETIKPDANKSVQATSAVLEPGTTASKPHINMVQLLEECTACLACYTASAELLSRNVEAITLHIHESIAGQTAQQVDHPAGGRAASRAAAGHLAAANLAVEGIQEKVRQVAEMVGVSQQDSVEVEAREVVS